MINVKLGQLKAAGLTPGDQLQLEKRLQVAWSNDSAQSGTTEWRKSRARSNYRRIQDANKHLFLSFVLTFAPTNCSQLEDSTIEHFENLEDYTPYHLDPGTPTKEFFESAATHRGFANSDGYLSFMKVFFPQTAEAQILEDTQASKQTGTGMGGVKTDLC
jgi:hypothetical protein